MLKGLLPVLAAGLVLRHQGETRDAATYGLWLGVGFAAILGHMFSVFLKFKGGKGVATSTGVVLGVFPYYTWPGLVAIAAFIVLFLITRYVSVASMIAAILFPIAYASIWGVHREQ